VAVVASFSTDLNGDGQQETVQSTDDNHTIVLRNGVVIWDHQGWIQGWNRRPWDSFLAVDVDHDGCQEIIIWNNQNDWTGVLKWQVNELTLLWASPPPLSGPAGQWNRRASDEFSATVYNGQIAVSIVHPEDGWHAILMWQTNALRPVLITQATVAVPDVRGFNATQGATMISNAGLNIGIVPQPGPPPDDPRIIGQNISPETIVALGTTVIIYIDPNT
jgi:hypothetical protein